MGYHDFVFRELWPFREATATLNLTQGTQEYSLADGLEAVDERNIQTVSLQGPLAKKLFYWPYNQLRRTEPDFSAIGESVPERYYIKAGQIGFWPTPNSSMEVVIDYYLSPEELVEDIDEPVIPLAYREALVQYGLSLEHDFNTDPDLAQKALNRYEQIVSLARQNLLTQPNDEGNFRVRGAGTGSPWLGLPGER